MSVCCKGRHPHPRRNNALLTSFHCALLFLSSNTTSIQVTAFSLIINDHHHHRCHPHHQFYHLQLQQDSSNEYEEYSCSLYTPRQERDQIDKEYIALYDEGPKWKKRMLRPIKRIIRTMKYNSFQQKNQNKKNKNVGTLILIKSGESEWKQKGIFTGWSNPPKLTTHGIQECRHAARLLLEAGYDEPDMIYTSMLNRAIQSVWIINQELNTMYIPTYKSWRLNERMYGSIQGLKKKNVAKEFGYDIVQSWRRSFKARPPPVSKNDIEYPGNDRRYANIDQELLPVSESLLDCMKRQQPLWQYKIKKDIQKGNNVVVVGHSNSLRGLAKIIDNIDDNDIENIAFPPGIPVVYKFDQNMNPILPSSFTGSAKQTDILMQENTSGVFLEKPGLLKEALRKQTEWQRTVPGSKDDTIAPIVKRTSTIEESLFLLKQEKEMERWASSQQQHPHHMTNHNPNEHNSIINGLHLPILKNGMGRNTTDEIPIKLVGGDSSNNGFDENSDSNGFEEPTFSVKATEPVVPNVGQVNVEKDPVVVLVRHGTTPFNELQLFTGWEDPPLSPDGVEDAKRAGRLLKQHGFEFDVVYTSWLSRAIETAWYVLDELDMLWLPMVKSWRLNERHYGKLTGRSKKMVGNIYGQDQLKKWRRSFDIAPPKTSSYSFSYPGNDYRRTKYVKDLRISFWETLCRSLEAKEFQIHRKFPKSESLKMCMKRTIPFYTQKIVPEAVAKGKRVLITSHENALRGILMHLCEIPQEHMNGLHLPNGLPLIYNVQRKCVSLLDDGTGQDPMEVHDFGSAAQYLFRPCEITEEDFAAMEENFSYANKQNTTVAVIAK